MVKCRYTVQEEWACSLIPFHYSLLGNISCTLLTFRLSFVRPPLSCRVFTGGAHGTLHPFVQPWIALSPSVLTHRYSRMLWIAPTEKDTPSETLEKRLWASAAQSRANSGLILDPACGSRGMFVSSSRFVSEHKRQPAVGQLAGNRPKDYSGEPTREPSIHGVEKTDEIGRLCRLVAALQDLVRTLLHDLMTAKTRVDALTFPATRGNS